jgi:signal transduction histidine kinase
MRDKSDEIYNKARILLQDELRTIDTKDPTHEFAIFDLEGKITRTNSNDYQVGQIINVVQELQTDHAFAVKNTNRIKVVFPILKDDTVTGFVQFFMDFSEVHEGNLFLVFKAFWPLYVWGIGAFVALLIYMNYMRKRVYLPMERMVESSKAIIEGDYGREILQESEKDKPEGVAQELLYSFEMMRDELKDKSIREEQLRKSQKELMSCMSHDLRTPIATIQAHAEAIRDGIVKEEDKKLQYIHTIIKKSEVVNRMIADLLDHSNAELNQLKINKKEQYVGTYLDELAEELRIYCNKNGCKFQYKNTCGEMLLNIDCGRITQVIYNLVENACKYMQQKDLKNEEEELSKDAEVVLTCKMKEEERRVYISVSDNGPGIEMIDIPYVFDRFYRAEKSRSTQIPGAGLGLSICRYIVEQHNGDISLTSKKGNGTTVTFYLPY